mmetsp:Transcript_7739/g.10901  ORF Transcript_7739/g.10901 Transcript_7739/m.10901 type:complete len:96 (+) Transcript_7739:70-357(+)
MANRMGDFEAQVTSQLQAMSQDIERKLAFMSTQPQVQTADRPRAGPGVESIARDLDAVKYDVVELKDLLNNTKVDTSQRPHVCSVKHPPSMHRAP